METKERRKLTKKEILIRDFMESRRAVFQAISGLSDNDMEMPMNESGVTVKKLLAHFVEWDMHEVNRTGRFFAGEEISFWADENHDAFNQQAFEKWGDKKPSEVVAAFFGSTDRVENLLKKLTERQLLWDKKIRFEEEVSGRKITHAVNPSWFLVEAQHDKSHALEIEAWKKEMGIGELGQTT